MKKHWIEFRNVSFSYKTQNLLSNFDFDVAGNQFVGIIGVNGSGKSTLLKLILGLLKPQTGVVRVLGREAGAKRRKAYVGSSLQDIDFPGSERVEEILRFVCQQYPIAASVEELIRDFNLQSFRRKPCSTLSGGMKRRLSLACAFAGQPNIVILDEPTTGLDQESRKKLMQVLKNYQKRHKALILMISHYPEEVIDSVDQFFHVKNKKVERVTTEQMQKFTAYRKMAFQCPASSTLPATLKVTRQGENVELVVADSDKYIRQLCKDKISFSNLSVRDLTAEEILGDIL